VARSEAMKLSPWYEKFERRGLNDDAKN